MRVGIYCDSQGVEKIELMHASDSEREQAHKLYLALRGEIEKLDVAAKAVAEVAGDGARG